MDPLDWLLKTHEIAALTERPNNEFTACGFIQKLHYRSIGWMEEGTGRYVKNLHKIHHSKQWIMSKIE